MIAVVQQTHKHVRARTHTHARTHACTRVPASDESNSQSQTNQLTALIANANMQIYIN